VEIMGRIQLEESIEVPKRTLTVIIKHFEILLKDFEKLAERVAMMEVDNRIKDIKKRKIKGCSERDYSGFMKSKGIEIE